MPESRDMTYAEALREALDDALSSDERVFMLGEDIGVYGGAFGVTTGLLAKHGEDRVRDTPISEIGIVGVAVGAALIGMRPIAEMQFSDFTANAMDQLCNQAAKLHFMYGGKAEVPMVLRAPTGSGTGAAAQHSQSIESWLLNVPGLKVVMPTTPKDAKGLLNSAIDDPNPVVFLEHKLLYKVKGDVPEDRYTIPIGEASVLREGSDVSIISWSAMVQRVLQAAAALSDQGIEADVVDVRTLRPLDRDTIVTSVAKTGRALVVHESPRTGGFGGEIAATIAEGHAFDFLEAPIKRLGGLEVPIPYNPDLERGVVPQEEDVVKAAVEIMSA
ncbi:MAG: alpha-ketoacid dehydrogenase subunit beta [Actinobacteria bacterium]|nr:alpha-ketoacid dehydrogenase subunit beta [Actinomycetota bacterium]